jgi:hypothetical protein
VVRKIGSSATTNITIQKVSPKTPTGAVPALKALERGLDPNGEECTPADVWRHRRTLVLGFAYVWANPPPDEWRKRRAAWGRRARRALDGQTPGWDTEGQVKATARAEGWPEWLRWQEVSGDYDPVTVPHWYDTSLLEKVAETYRDDWLVWVEHVAVGEKLQALSGRLYFRHKGYSREGKFLEDADGTCICSIGGCTEGLNLQYRWHRNLVLTPPTLGLVWEQLLGRTHRRGQLDDVEVVVHATHQQADIDQALADARYRQSLAGAQQKLLIADWT